MFRIHGRFVVLVARQAGEYSKVCRIGVTLRTGSPLSTVISAINWEMLSIVVEG